MDESLEFGAMHCWACGVVFGLDDIEHGCGINAELCRVDDFGHGKPRGGGFRAWREVGVADEEFHSRKPIISW